MRAATTDMRLTALHCEWEGAPGASPSRLLLSGTTVRRNLCSRPLGVSATTADGYQAANSASIQFVPGVEPGCRVTATAGGSKYSGISIPKPSTVESNAAYTLSVDVTGEVEDSWHLSIQGSGMPVQANSPDVLIRVGETARLQVTFSPVSDAIAIYVLRGTAAVASQAVIRRVLIEKSALVHPFFDGSTEGADMMRLYETLPPPPAS